MQYLEITLSQCLFLEDFLVCYPIHHYIDRKDSTMAEDKKEIRGTEISLMGDKYFCKECGSEVPLKKPCPVCKKEIDWDRVFTEIHR